MTDDVCIATPPPSRRYSKTAEYKHALLDAHNFQWSVPHLQIEPSDLYLDNGLYLAILKANNLEVMLSAGSHVHRSRQLQVVGRTFLA